MNNKKLFSHCHLLTFASTIICASTITSCKASSNEFILNSHQELENYLINHAKVHNDSIDWSSVDNNDPTMCSWFWDRKHFGAQNIVNGFLLFFVDFPFSTIRLKVQNNSFTFYYLYQEAYTQWENISMSWESNNGPITYDSSINTGEIRHEVLDSVIYLGQGDILHTWNISYKETLTFSVWDEEYPFIQIP